jgi:hypothetical protein
MKKVLVFFVCSLLIASGYAQSELPDKYPDPSKVKVKEDFPKEGRTGKSGKGFSANIGNLPNGIKKVALVSFYAFDPGLTKTWSTSYTVKGDQTGTKPTWSSTLAAGLYGSPEMETTFTNYYKTTLSTGAISNKIAYGAFETSIVPMMEEFKTLGIELLLPNQFLKTEEQKNYYNSFHVKHEKSFANWVSKFGAADHDVIYGSVGGFIVADIVKEPFANYEKSGLFQTRKDNVVDDQIYFYDKDTDMTESLGYDLCTQLGVDAVLVTFMTVFMPKDSKIELVNVRFIMFGPNPTMPEVSKGGMIPHVKGLFYYGGSVIPETLIYNKNKKDPETDKLNFAGFDNIYIALVRDFGEYYKKKMEK